MTKDLPHSKDAEENVLSAIFLDGVSALSKCLDGHLSAASFYDKHNGQLFQTFLWLHKSSRALTLDVVHSELDRVKKLDAIGGLDALIRLSSKLPTTAELPYFIERVRETYMLRKLIETADRVKDLAMNETANIELYAKEVNDIISARYSTQTIKTLPEATLSVIDMAKRIIAGQATEEDVGLSWPWPDWNERFGTMLGGQLIIVAARPGQGKSTIARQTCDNIAVKYGDTAIFSREMPIEEMSPLFAQSRCGISWRALRKRQLHSKEEEEFMASLEEIRQLKSLHVFDRDRTLSQVVARVKSFAQIRPLKFLAIDYLQRYDPEQSKGETRDVALGRMSMAFKDLAIDLKIPVLLLCQVGRGLEREKREPIMSDLRESGNLEQDADRIIFLNAPENNEYTGVKQDPYDFTLENLYVNAIQVKGRGDGCAKVGMMLHRPTTTFRSITR